MLPQVCADGINVESSCTNLIDGIGLKPRTGADGVPVVNIRISPGVSFSIASISSFIQIIQKGMMKLHLPFI